MDLQHESSPVPAPRAITRKLRAHAVQLRALRVPAAPLAISVIAAVAFALPDQIREIYRDYALNISASIDELLLMLPMIGVGTQARPFNLERLYELFLQGILQTFLGFLFMFAASWFIWKLARQLMLQYIDRLESGVTPPALLMRWLPPTCGAAIACGAFWGNVLAARDPLLVSPYAWLPAPALLVLAASLSLLWIVVLFALEYRRTSRQGDRYERETRWLTRWHMFYYFAAITVASALLFCAPALGRISIKLAQFLGSPAIFCLFVMLVAYWASLLSAVRVEFQLPAISILAVIVIAFAWTGCNDNHEVAVRPTEKRVPAIKEAFRAWYRGRADRQAYEAAGKPYPVFLVSAAGGGLYAADFTATALGRIQDHCPGFAQHVFAISGVSGGGLGAAVFSRLLMNEVQVRTADMRPGTPDPCELARERPRNQRSFEDEARHFLHEDFLAPIAGAGLFPDFLQRLVPIPLTLLDRSRAFEASLDLRWRELHEKLQMRECRGDCAPFRQAFLDHWSSAGVTPALVFNTTDIDLGLRVAVAPFLITPLPTAERPVYVPDEYSATTDFHSRMKNIDVTLGTAVGLSARFPWLLPPASFSGQQGDGGRAIRRKMRLLDGGLFENSGVDTVRDMMFELEEFETRRAGEPWVVLHPIIISGYKLNVPERSTNFQGELLAPVTAMLQTRLQRAGMASYRLFKARGYHCGKVDQVDLSPHCNHAGGIRFLVLNHEDYKLPLGWHLSQPTREVIHGHIGDARKCDPIPKIAQMFVGPDAEQRKRFTIAENNCTACSVISTLRGKSLIENNLCRRG